MLGYLPQELLDEITALLGPGDIARLMVANRQLFLRLEHLAYNHSDIRNRAMLEACRTGLLHLIRHLVLVHGVPVSTVQINSALLLTLDIAAARDQMEAFCMLLELGARVDIPLQARRNHRKLIKHVSSATSDPSFLHLFFEVGLDAQLRAHHPPSFILGQSLLWVARNVKQSPPLGQVKLLLEHGAGTFANKPYESYRYYFLTPLTTFMYHRDYNPIPVLKLLASAGVSVQGPEIAAPVTRPTHIPIFVAMEVMATTGDTALLEWCLQNGASINHQVPLIDREMYPDGYMYYYSNPALFYADCIKPSNFTEDVAAEIKDLSLESRISNPVEGLKCLMERGARMDPARDAHDGRTRLRAVMDYTNKSTPWCLERILRNCGLGQLQTNATFRSTVEFLLRRSLHRGDITEMLVRCEYALRPDHVRWSSYPQRWKPQSEQTVKAWPSLLQLVDTLVAAEQRSNITPTHILSEYIACKAQRLDAIHEIGRATIDHLLSAGADINAQVAGEPDGTTPLHQLCRQYNIHAKTRSALTGVHQRSVRRDMPDFVQHLLSKGADRSRIAQGYSPKELLFSDIVGESASFVDPVISEVANSFS